MAKRVDYAEGLTVGWKQWPGRVKGQWYIIRVQDGALVRGPYPTEAEARSIMLGTMQV